jgi:hypothetical protein
MTAFCVGLPSPTRKEIIMNTFKIIPLIAAIAATHGALSAPIEPNRLQCDFTLVERNLGTLKETTRGAYAQILGGAASLHIPLNVNGNNASADASIYAGRVFLRINAARASLSMGVDKYTRAVSSHSTDGVTGALEMQTDFRNRPTYRLAVPGHLTGDGYVHSLKLVCEEV